MGSSSGNRCCWRGVSCIDSNLTGFLVGMIGGDMPRSGRVKATAQVLVCGLYRRKLQGLFHWVVMRATWIWKRAYQRRRIHQCGAERWSG